MTREQKLDMIGHLKVNAFLFKNYVRSMNPFLKPNIAQKLAIKEAHGEDVTEQMNMLLNHVAGRKLY